jgi:hypothetical protein
MAISSTTLRRRRRLKVGGVRADRRAAHLQRDGLTAAAQRGDAIQRTQPDHAHGEQRAEHEQAAAATTADAAEGEERGEVHHRDDAEHRQREQDHEARRIPPRRRLAFEEVHVARGLELHFRRRTHLRLLLAGNLQQRRGQEVEEAGEDRRGESLALVVVGHHRIVEGLAREGDLVSVEVSSSVSCIMFWLALRSG